MIPIRLTLVFAALLAFVSAGAQEMAALRGRLLHAGEPLIAVNVMLLGTERGTMTDEDGWFALDKLEPGTCRLRFSALGYQPKEVTVAIRGEELHELGDLELDEDVFGLQTVVVTGTMKETFIRESPVKVEVISSSFLEKHLAPTNLMESVSLLGGAQEVVACGVCFTNSISLNGLPGPYTAVLLDGAPVYGALASVYGLNGIPQSLIERFEVIRGPNSTLYGSEAVAGVINIITKDPAKQPVLALDLRATSRERFFGNLTTGQQWGRWRGLAGFDFAYANSFQDDNGDMFGDFVNHDRLAFFTKWSLERPENRKFIMAGKIFYEDRRNGVEGFLRDRAYRRLRGSRLLYGESIYTRRAELSGSYELAFVPGARLDFSLSYHDQDSYYGVGYYRARQRIAFSNLLWPKQMGRHDLLLGLTARLQDYEDNTVATRQADGSNAPERQFVPGIFAQDEWRVNDALSLLAGSRFDYFPAHGLIFSPRLSLKLKAGEWTTFRLNSGNGFRIVNLFAEDHAFLSGQREVVIAENLRPERSFNLAFNLHHVFVFGPSQGNFDFDAHYTYFTNKIIPDYTLPGKIVYANLNGYAVTRGAGVTWQQQFEFPLSVNVNVQYQDVFQAVPSDRGGLQTQPVLFAPRWSGAAAVSYTWHKAELSMAYTADWTGSMALPVVFDLDPSGQPLSFARPARSRPFTLHHIQITRDFHKPGMEIYGGIKNLFGYRQPFSPLTGHNDPKVPVGFSPYFDTSYAYGPLMGRECFLGARWKFAR